MFKKIMIHTRRSVKIIILSGIAAILIIAIFAFFYKPTYSVTINGEQVGYTENKSELQEEINQYIEKGDGDNVAFVQVENLPQYKMCLLKKDVVTNDDEIFEKVKESGTKYYRYYALSESDQEKVYVSNFEKAEKIVNELKEKESSNIDNIAIVEKYETEPKDLVEQETAVSQLFTEPEQPEPVTVTTATANTTKTATKVATTGGIVNTATTISSGNPTLGVNLIKPISGTITSRFGAISSVRSSAHTGLDLSAPIGTKISAAASGIVSFAGYKGSYGNMLVINHSNGVQTYYCHCSALYASVGDSIQQGDIVAAVGSTGNSTGAHLHFEVRINGVAYNPESYIF